MSSADPQHALDAWAAALLARLAPGARRQLARTLAMEVRCDQQRRIAAQQNPDGSPYTPRKSRQQTRSGRIRRKAMFGKLRRARHLRIRTDATGAEIGFSGRSARIARVHQEGGTDRVSPRGPRIRYARRELLGISPALRARIRALLLDHLTGTGSHM